MKANKISYLSNIPSTDFLNKNIGDFLLLNPDLSNSETIIFTWIFEHGTYDLASEHFKEYINMLTGKPGEILETFSLATSEFQRFEAYSHENSQEEIIDAAINYKNYQASDKFKEIRDAYYKFFILKNDIINSCINLRFLFNFYLSAYQIEFLTVPPKIMNNKYLICNTLGSTLFQLQKTLFFTDYKCRKYFPQYYYLFNGVFEEYISPLIIAQGKANNFEASLNKLLYQRYIVLYCIEHQPQFNLETIEMFFHKLKNEFNQFKNSETWKEFKEQYLTPEGNDKIVFTHPIVTEIKRYIEFAHNPLGMHLMIPAEYE